MNKTIVCLLFCFAISISTIAQEGDTDSSKVLGEVIVKAYEQNRQLKQVATAVNYIGQQQLERFSNTVILPALNSTPGVRMEERSPGSYRMNIRGSTIRSPFGVRNVKVYWDGIPFTDPGGNTYLNQLSYYNFNSIEIIKGPAGSLYGAGTGGAILINSQPKEWQPGLDLRFLFGSFGLNNESVQFTTGKNKFKNVIGYTYQRSDGYRNHTNMRRDIGTWQSQVKISPKDQLNINILYGDLYYQTPGALTKAEYNNNPRSARPAAGIFPSAETAKAAIYQKTFLTGINNKFTFHDRLENNFIFYGAISKIKNPTFRNYESRREPHFGGRTFFNWKPKTKNDFLRIVFGAEMQQGYFNIKTYNNVSGEPGTLMTDDDVRNSIYSLFAQTDFHLPHDLNITTGISSTQSSISITRINTSSPSAKKRTYRNEAAPRLAVSKRVIKNLWLYGSISRGFSPPTTAEVLPSTGIISTSLNAEHGINYEAGIKSGWLKNRLYGEVNIFYYRLKDAIVLRRDASNADYFTNAGSTKQKGIESQVSYLFFESKIKIISRARIWIAYTKNDFSYDDFKQTTNDYSGNKIPSVSPNTVASGIDLYSKTGIYTNITYFYSDKIALNDANTEFASSYNLLSMRIGCKRSIFQKKMFDFFAGADNLLDEKYSLGNDINAAGGRYFNAAPVRNYYIGITFSSK